MKLFGSRGGKSSFSEFDTRQKSRKLQQVVLKANTPPKRAAFEAMLGKRSSPLFTTELKGAQTFTSFKKMDDGVKRAGLGRFFKRPRDYAKGEKE